VHGLHRMYHRLGNRFCPIELLGDVGHLESRFGPFRDDFGVIGR
jgi:hypothetical protein